MPEKPNYIDHEKLLGELNAIYELFGDESSQGEVTINFDGESYSVKKTDLHTIVNNPDFHIFMILLQNDNLAVTAENELEKFIDKLHSSFRDLESSQKEGQNFEA